jgi:hypothetical protein
MSLHPRHLLLAIAALVVPLQAGALSGGGDGGLATPAQAPDSEDTPSPAASGAELSQSERQR